MPLFETVFNKSSIYDMLFFSIKPVLAHPTFLDLGMNNVPLWNRWKYIAETKHNTTNDNEVNSAYLNKAVYYPEFTKIIAITYASAYFEEGEIKRYINRIVNDDEFITIGTFTNVLNQISVNAPNTILCGHNIISNEIPLLIKRYVLHRNKFQGIELPAIIKNSLDSKPWETNVLDTVNLWKFNGYEYTPLMLIADYLGLKKSVELVDLPTLSKAYWNLVNENKHKEALEYVSFQSANQVNLIIQLVKELRVL